jgi:hypothetical protein
LPFFFEFGQQLGNVLDRFIEHLGALEGTILALLFCEQ